MRADAGADRSRRPTARSTIAGDGLLGADSTRQREPSRRTDTAASSSSAAGRGRTSGARRRTTTAATRCRNGARAWREASRNWVVTRDDGRADRARPRSRSGSRARLPDVESTNEIVYTVYGNGEIEIDNSFQPGDAELSGAAALRHADDACPTTFETMTWYGRGPHESYWDRKAGAAVGVYSGSVDEQYFDYSEPQENGNKTDVRWVSLTRADGVGLQAVGMPPAQRQRPSLHDRGHGEGQAPLRDAARETSSPSTRLQADRRRRRRQLGCPTAPAVHARAAAVQLLLPTAPGVEIASEPARRSRGSRTPPSRRASAD